MLANSHNVNNKKYIKRPTLYPCDFARTSKLYLSIHSEHGNPACANIKQALEHAEYDESNTFVLEGFNTTAENHVKEILFKLNLPDHRSILTNSKITPTKQGRMTKLYSFLIIIANCLLSRIYKDGREDSAKHKTALRFVYRFCCVLLQESCILSLKHCVLAKSRTLRFALSQESCILALQYCVLSTSKILRFAPEVLRFDFKDLAFCLDTTAFSKEQFVAFCADCDLFKIFIAQMHNNIMAAVLGIVHRCLQQDDILNGVHVQAVEAIDDSPAIPEHTTVETPMNMSPENKAHFLAKKEAIHLILTGIRDEIYSTVDACQTAQEIWEAIERLQQGESLKIQDVKTNLFWEFGLAREANPLALVATTQVNQDPYYQTTKSHKSYAPSSKPLILTRSHTTTRYKGKEIAKPITPPSEIAFEEDIDLEQAQRDKDMQKNLALIAKAREKVGSLVVQQSGIQCFNCKEFGYFAKECRKPKRQYDCLADTDGEVDEQELQARYSYMAKIQEVPTANTSIDFKPVEQVQNDAVYNVFSNDLQHSEQSEYVSNTCLVETDDSNVILDSPDVCKDAIQNAQNDVESDDEHVALANLITNLKLNAEFEKYKAFIDRTIDCDKLEHKLNETLEIVDNAWIKYSKDQFHASTAQDMKILIQTCLMPLAIKTQNDSFRFVHELKQEMHVDLKYVESLEKEIDELEFDKAEFSNMYDVILQECVSNDVKCSYLQSLSNLDALAELQCLYLHKVKEWDSLAQKLSKQTESVSKKVHTELLKCFAKVEKHWISLEIDLQKCKEQTLPQTARQAMSNTNVLKPGMYRMKSRTTQTRAPQLPQTIKNTNPRVSTSTGVNHKTNVSRPQRKSNQLKDKVVPNNSQVEVKKTQVEVYPRDPSVSNKMKSVTACKDSLNSRTLNANVVCATCNKCLVDSNHFARVTKMLNDVNARTKNPNIVQLILFIVGSGCTKHMTGNLKLLCNFVEKFLGLNHNLFSVGHFCDADFEVTFRKSTYFVRDLQGNDLLTGSPVVQQFGIQCFNCKEFGHFAKECRKPKRVKDSAYHKEKMLLCKQVEQGVPLQA
nr:integrase, catalytic region, zinc finger, CCHC-type, peptidase aspartic, catalytic [Tanacetum cinerariifolium]